MKRERLKNLIARLHRYELTGLEKRFAQEVEDYFNRKRMRADRPESMMESISGPSNPALGGKT